MFSVKVILMHCFNYSILSLVNIVDLLLCLIYKLNFIIGMFRLERTYIRSSVIPVVSASTGGAGRNPPRIEETVLFEPH